MKWLLLHFKEEILNYNSSFHKFSISEIIHLKIKLFFQLKLRESDCAKLS